MCTLYSCTHWLRPRNFPPPPSTWAHIRGHYWAAKIGDIFLCNPLVLFKDKFFWSEKGNSLSQSPPPPLHKKSPKRPPLSAYLSQPTQDLAPLYEATVPSLPMPVTGGGGGRGFRGIYEHIKILNFTEYKHLNHKLSRINYLYK